jgi:hypothetical protein
VRRNHKPRASRMQRRILRCWWRRLGFAGEPLGWHGPHESLDMVFKRVYPAELMRSLAFGPSFLELLP